MPKAEVDVPEGVVCEGDNVLVYPAVRQGVRNLNRRALFVMLPVALLMFLIFGFLGYVLSGLRTTFQQRAAAPFVIGHTHAVADLRSIDLAILLLTAAPWAIAALYVAIYIASARSVRKLKDPIISLIPEGMVINGQLTKVGLLRWEEIAGVRAYTFIYRFLGIVPQDTAALIKRLERRPAAILRTNVLVIPLYRLFGIFVAPINIPQEHLPITADELFQIITAYAARPRKTTETDVWPPQPQPLG